MKPAKKRPVKAVERPSQRAAMNDAAALAPRSKNLRSTERFDRIEQLIRQHNPSFNIMEFHNAVKWADANFREPKRKTVNDHFSDAPLLAEKLVKYVKADRETILASVLYPAVRPLSGYEPDPYRLAEIEKMFGAKVRAIVEDTLRLRALPYLKHKHGNSHTREQHLELSHVTALWTAHSPQAIAIRGTQLAVNLEMALQKPGEFSAETVERMHLIAEDSMGPISYLAGFGELNRKLRNLAYQTRNPGEFAEVSQIIKDKLSPRNADAIQQAVVSHIEKSLGMKAGVHFDVEFRQKSAASAKAKLDKKNAEIELKNKEILDPVKKLQLLKIDDLGDLQAMRIVMKMPAIGAKNVDLTKLGKQQRNKLLRDFAVKDHLVYRELARKFGRGNKQLINMRTKRDGSGKPILGADKEVQTERYSHIQERLLQLAVSDARANDSDRLKNPQRYKWEQNKYPNIHDARFDDYLSYPKPSGYSALQDIMFVPIPGRAGPVEIECQIVDEIRDENNTYGPRAGHIFYKAGIKEPGMTKAVMDWFKMVKTEFAGRTYRGPQHVHVMDPNGQIYDVSRNPTVAGFLDAAKLTCAEVQIASNDDYKIDLKRPTAGPHTPVRNGNYIYPVNAAA